MTVEPHLVTDHTSRPSDRLLEALRRLTRTPVTTRAARESTPETRRSTPGGWGDGVCRGAAHADERPCTVRMPHRRSQVRSRSTGTRRHAISRIARTLRRLVNQDVARTNAAGASAVLQERRDEHDDVNAYLDALARDGGHPPEVARS